jgi:hypothetical protein
MLSLAGIATQRHSFRVESGMPAGIEPMLGGIMWKVLVPPLLPSFFDVFVQFAITAELLNWTGLCK